MSAYGVSDRGVFIYYSMQNSLFRTTRYAWAGSKDSLLKYTKEHIFENGHQLVNIASNFNKMGSGYGIKFFLHLIETYTLFMPASLTVKVQNIAHNLTI